MTVKSARAETMRSVVLCAIALKRYLLRHGKPAPDLGALAGISFRRASGLYGWQTDQFICSRRRQFLFTQLVKMERTMAETQTLLGGIIKQRFVEAARLRLARACHAGGG